MHVEVPDQCPGREQPLDEQGIAVRDLLVFENRQLQNYRHSVDRVIELENLQKKLEYFSCLALLRSKAGLFASSIAPRFFRSVPGAMIKDLDLNDIIKRTRTLRLDEQAEYEQIAREDVSSRGDRLVASTVHGDENAILEAISKGVHLDMEVGTLPECPGSVEARTTRPLSMAAAEGNYRIVTAILDSFGRNSPVRIHSRDYYGTSLWAAVMHGQHHIVEFLCTKYDLHQYPQFADGMLQSTTTLAMP